MNFIEGIAREEVLLLPNCLDDYIDADSPLRFLEQFVEGLDLEKCGFEFPREDFQGRGRPSYHPKDLLKLYIYGYLNGIRSGRKLEKACHVNIEVIWLMRELRPDFKTICDFRRKNRRAFVKVTSQFTQLCRRLDLFSGELIAIDGSKVKGVNAPGKNWSLSKLENHLKRVQKNIEEYLACLEAIDEVPAENDSRRRDETEEKLAGVRKKKSELEALREQLEKSGNTQLSFSDGDCRAMSRNNQKIVGYNIQTAVDGKHKLIVSSEVTNNVQDIGLLAPMARKAKTELDLEKADVIADKGYYNGRDLEECEKMGMTPHVSTIKNSPSERKGLFGADDFIYLADRDVYICPNRQELLPPARKRKSASSHISYRNVRACRGCPLKKRCTTSAYRSVNHGPCHDALKNTRERIDQEPEKIAQRGAIVEHPFSCLKKQILTGGFNVKGLEMVRAEMALAHLAYNLKRLFKIMTMKELWDRLRTNMTNRSTGWQRRYYEKVAHTPWFIAA